MLPRDHYQRAFEDYVREQRIPYVSVDEARRALLPEGSGSGGGGGRGIGPGGTAIDAATLKSFDFVVYGAGGNLLVEVKGRKVSSRRPPPGPEARARSGPLAPARTRLESWVTLDDVESLRVWEGLFGPGFVAVFAFVYWCQELPPGALFEDFVEREGRWYAIRCVARADYERAMRTRSPRWRTVHLAAEAFDRLSRPLAAARAC